MFLVRLLEQLTDVRNFSHDVCISDDTTDGSNSLTVLHNNGGEICAESIFYQTSE